MKKLIGATCLVAGTCIGAGMIALPIILASLGAVKSIILLITIWAITYLASLMTLELNLRSGEGTPLGLLGRKFGGKFAEIIGLLCLKLLAYSLLAAYIYGCSSVLGQFLNIFNIELSKEIISCGFAAFIFLCLILPIKYLDYTNRILFAGLVTALTVVICILFLAIYGFDISIASSSLMQIGAGIAVIFTSFGFQIVSHTLTDYCDKNKDILKKAFFWGSFIPLLIYIIWILGVLSILKTDAVFYENFITNGVEVGTMISKISTLTSSKFLKELIWVVSILAIITSAIGVGIGLLDSWRKQVNQSSMRMALLTVVPSLICALFIPNAFITALSFAGIINIIIVLLLPLYLIVKSDGASSNYHYAILKYKLIKVVFATLATVLIVYEATNLIG